MSYVHKFLGVVCHWVSKLLILKYGPYSPLLSWTPGIIACLVVYCNNLRRVISVKTIYHVVYWIKCKLFNLWIVLTLQLIIACWTIRHIDIFTSLIFPFTAKILRWPLVPDFRRQSSKSDFCPGLILSPIPPPFFIFQILFLLRPGRGANPLPPPSSAEGPRKE